MDFLDLILGIDLGTTHIKVATFGLDGSLQSLHWVATPTINLGGGQAVYDPETLWKSVVNLLQKTVHTVGTEKKIISLAVTSMAEAGLLLDAEKVPLIPVLSWYDVRGKKEAKEWFERVKPQEFFATTGLNPNHIYSLFKILWLQKNEPELYARAKFWMCLPDYVNFRLTGNVATDYSIASRTGMFDLPKKSWSDSILAAGEIEANLLPPLLPSGSALGPITPEVAQETGLPSELVVSLGGHDHVCGAFAAQVTEPFVLLDSMGTSESFISVLPALENLDLEAFQGFNVGHHVAVDRYYLQGGASSNGASIEWYLAKFYGTEGLANPYSELIRLGKASELGANGLVFVPQLRGGGPPKRNPQSKGSFLGIRDYHTEADFARSVLEGVAFEGQRVLEGMEQVLDHKFQRVKVIGGGTKNDLWLEIKNALTQAIVEIPPIKESTLLGAALLGAIGARVFKDQEDALKEVSQSGYLLERDPSSRGDYYYLYQKYLRLLPHLGEINTIIDF